MSEQPLTDAEIAAIEALEAQATPGPWIVAREHPVAGTIGCPVVQMYDDEALVVGRVADDWLDDTPPEADAAFIAAARTAIPALLHTLRYWQAQAATAIHVSEQASGERDAEIMRLQRGLRLIQAGVGAEAGSILDCVRQDLARLLAGSAL